jgi:sterol desaturase/sphingolipid hydroxylase (fatty acid hydroxylase superfamily)
MEIAKLAVWVFAVFAIAAALEAAILIRLRNETYDWRESAASIGVAIGQRIINTALGGFVFAVFIAIWDFRIWTIVLDAWYDYVLFFFAVEFAYYWHHRMSHEVRWFWATHSVHHSPQKLYLSGAIRLGWTGQVSGVFLFYAPLVLIGFHPIAVLATLLVNLIYQFWLHTELIGKLPGFDWIFNSPSNHRVHHAVNAVYLDRNYGGVVVIFDHLFGTYQRELDHAPPRYGLVKQIHSHNPFRIAFNEWLGIARDLRRAKSNREVLGHLFAPPGWSPNGRGMTSKRIRALATSRSQQGGLDRVRQRIGR